MPSPVVQWWRLLSAAAVLSACLAYSNNKNYLQDPELRSLGLTFKILPPRTTVMVLGKEKTIPCQPITTKNGVANVTWIKDAMVLNDERRHVLPNGTLFIKSVRRQDAGMYSCILTFSNYSVAAPFTYLVSAMVSVWQVKPNNQTVKEGRAARLTCHLASLPEPSYVWMKDNETLPENETRYYRPYSNVLQITSVKLQDQGMYSCQAVNELLNKEFHSPGGYLSVIPRHNSGLESESVSRHTLLPVPTKVSSRLGDRAVLECISNEEEPCINWSMIDGMPILENRTKRTGQGSLEFSSIMEYDRGVYNCTAPHIKNEGVRTQMIELNVLTPPIAQLSMMVSSRHVPRSTMISNGHFVRMTCSTWGYPPPTISWFKNGILHVESGRHQYTNNNTSSEFAAEDLVITSLVLSDMGLYQCVARNEAGVGSDGLIVKVDTANLPDPPTNIRALEIHPHRMHLVWDAPSKTPVSGYIVNFALSKNLLQEKVVNISSVVKKELKSNTNYTIYIRSFFIMDGAQKPTIGDPSEFITIKTKDKFYPPDPVEMPRLRLIPKSPTELHVHWTLADYGGNNSVEKQEIQWKERKQHYYDTEMLLGNVTSFTFRNLTQNRLYYVRVIIATEAGYPEHLVQVPWYHVRMPKGGPTTHHDTNLLTVHLSTSSEKPTEIMVKWIPDASLQKDIICYRVFYNNSVSTWQSELQSTNTSLILTDLDTEKCYAVHVQAIFQGNKNTTKSLLKTLCTFPVSPYMVSQQSNTNKIRVKKLKAKVLNSTSILVTWRHTSRRLLVNFYTIRIENIKFDWSAIAGGEELDWKNEVNSESEERGVRSPESTQYGDETSVLDSQDNQTEVLVRKDLIFHRVTSKRLVVTNLRPLHNYSISVTASTTTFTGPSSVTFITPDEGVPTPPRNVTWKPASPKDAILTWSPPRFVNGHLLRYLVRFSHDELEWRNQTIDSNHTSTQIQDLVSNTNYTLHIAGVTGKGVGASTTVFVYIRATLEGDPQITTESVVVISVVSLLAVVTCVVAVLLCFKILRLRNNSSSVFQGNGTCRMVYANGVKSSGRDHGTEPDDYKPMLASLPPATQNHHLDTKADGTSECMEPLRDRLSQHRMLDTLDDIDDASDASRRLLQSMSTAQPVFSKNMKEFDHTRPLYNSTQVDHHSSTEDAGMDQAVSS